LIISRHLGVGYVYESFNFYVFHKVPILYIYGQKKREIKISLNFNLRLD